MLNCSQCEAENQVGALFCEMCGSRLAAASDAPPAAPSASAAGAACPTCGHPAIPGEAFCDSCGASLEPGPTPAPAPSVAPPAQPSPQPVYPPPQPLAEAAAAAGACPACGASVLPGEAFCDSCGASLSGARPPAAAAAAPAAPSSLQGMALEIAGSHIALPAQQEVLLGRQDAASGHFPDIDLMPFAAFEHGVGRRHARLLLRDGQVLIEDLDSTNGTLVERQRLQPRQPVALSGGEEIRLGKLVCMFRRGAM